MVCYDARSEANRIIMSIMNRIDKIELEITSDCNALCPGCARTQHLDKITVQDFGLEDLKRILPTREHIDGKIFKFCGVLGDPAANVECLPMVKYLVENGGWCQLSTNGGIQPASWWRELGELSAKTNSVDVSFCIDGHQETNHIYRVGTKFSTIDRNIQAYSDGGNGIASATWIYIVFDHNEHELDKAREHAERLGFKFATRTGMRNSYHNWVSVTKKKDKETKKIVEEVKTITTTGAKEHSKKKEVEKIDQFIKAYSKGKEIDQEKKLEMIKSITCKMVHEAEIFIAADQTVWPCCFLHDSAVKNQDAINDKLAQFGDNWNSLKHHTLEEILSHVWFRQLIRLSWDPEHEMHLKRCVRSCASNKAYQNEINYES